MVGAVHDVVTSNNPVVYFNYHPQRERTKLTTGGYGKVAVSACAILSLKQLDSSQTLCERLANTLVKILYTNRQTKDPDDLTQNLPDPQKSVYAVYAESKIVANDIWNTRPDQGGAGYAESCDTSNPNAATEDCKYVDCPVSSSVQCKEDQDTGSGYVPTKIPRRMMQICWARTDIS